MNSKYSNTFFFSTFLFKYINFFLLFMTNYYYDIEDKGYKFFKISLLNGKSVIFKNWDTFDNKLTDVQYKMKINTIIETDFLGCNPIEWDEFEGRYEEFFSLIDDFINEFKEKPPSNHPYIEVL